MNAQQRSLPPNPYSYLFLLYLTIVLILRVGVHAIAVTNGMVLIPAIPLLGLLLIIVMHAASGSKWN
jgi:hypothetical protein